MIEKKVEIEFASFSDAIELSVLSRRFIERGLVWTYTDKKICKAIKDRCKNVVVARNGRRIVGFGIMRYEEEAANLELLAVRTLYRRKGIGTKIVRWLEKVASTAGIFNLYVQVREKNKNAIEFYAKLGYEIIDIVPGYYQRKETGVILYRYTVANYDAT